MRLRFIPRFALAVMAAALFVSTGLSAQSTGLPLKLAPKPTEPSITAADLMTRLYQFADDSMAGRATGTEGHVKATAYIASEMARLGLTPGGENGTYFQDLPYARRGFAEGGTIVASGRRLSFGEDFGILSPGGGRIQLPPNAQVVFGGDLGDSTTYISAEEARGKVVVMRRSPRVQQISTRALQVSADSRFAGAAAYVVPMWDDIPAAFRRNMTQPSLSMVASDAPVLPPTILMSVSSAEAVLGAPLSGARAADGASVTFSLSYSEESVPARNVIAILPGSDPTLKSQYVAVGAHNDHDPVVPRPLDHDSLRTMAELRARIAASLPEGQRPTVEQLGGVRVNMDSLRALGPARMDSIKNGADDDGSGSVAVLEIAEAMASAPDKPKRSVIFIWHAAEELGLHGAGWFTLNPTVERDSIVAMLNLDMVGRGGVNDIPGGGPDYVQLIGSRRLSTELGDRVEAINSARSNPFRFDYSLDANGHPENIYCRSDHAMYARFGIPVVFFTTGLHKDYHQITDEPQYIEYDKLSELTGFIRDVLVDVANASSRPVVDQPKPDPFAPCRQ